MSIFIIYTLNNVYNVYFIEDYIIVDIFNVKTSFKITMFDYLSITKTKIFFTQSHIQHFNSNISVNIILCTHAN